MQYRKCELICTGSELLQTKVNRYTPLFAGKLQALGFRIQREHTVGDDAEIVTKLINCALKNADLVITCGGLGPTFDDVTRQAAAKATGRRLEPSRYAEQILRNNYGFEKTSPEMKDQCLILNGAKMVENSSGTAFGQILRLGKKMLVLLPGPQNEWEPMFDAFIAGDIAEHFGAKNGTIIQRRVRIAGLTEVETQKALKPIMRKFKHADFNILAGPATTEFSFTVSGRDRNDAANKSGEIECACHDIFGQRIYATDEDTMEGRTAFFLKEQGLTLCAAESCSGGGLSNALTDIPGASAWFLGSITAYSNRAKMNILGVAARTISRHGAVSRECALEMAQCARKLFGADYAISITGIAGPDGGNKYKPVGLVYYAVAGPDKTICKRGHFHGTRTFIKKCAANSALDELRKIIQLKFQ